MPFENHPAFSCPADDVVIWRYVTMGKLADLLTRRALWFGRLDKLADPWEGAYTQLFINKFKALCAELPNGDSELQWFKGMHDYRRTVAVNCWHENEHESAALWDLYGSGKETVAIKSTVGRLKMAMAEFNEGVHIGAVRYMDYEKEMFPFGNVLSPSLVKRKSFAHEREVRAVLWLRVSGRVKWEGDAPVESGIYVEVDPAVLIQSLFLHSGSAPWLRDAVQAVAETTGLNGASVQRSSLHDPVIL